MANTIAVSQCGVTITFDGSTAWDGATLFPDGILLDSMEYIVVAASNAINNPFVTILFRVKTAILC